MSKSPITTHVLDTSRGRPASRVAVTLERQTEEGVFAHLADGATDDDGRASALIEPGTLRAGVYRISFDTAGYYARVGGDCFYPSVSIAFRVEEETEHYHVPLLLNPYGYSTYRGS